MVGNIDRQHLLPYKNKSNNFDRNTIYFKFPYDFNIENISSVFNAAFNSISNSRTIDGLNFKIVNSMQSNLNSLFVHGIKLPNMSKFRYIKCSNLDCRICPFSNSNPYFKFGDLIIPVQNNSSCNSKNIIYIIRCKMCNSLYIGQSQSLKNRLRTHIKGSILNITDYSSCTCVVEHFNMTGHNTIRDMEFFVFREKNFNKWSRLNLESQLLNMAKKLNVKLINILIPDPYYWNRIDKLFDNL